MKKVIETSKAPAAVGPYSQGIIFKDLVFTSGQLPINKETGKLETGDIKLQAECAMNNVKAIIEEAGLTMDDVIKVNIYFTDLNDFAAVNEVYAGFFSGDRPARLAVEVAALPLGATIEIEAIAGK